MIRFLSVLLKFIQNKGSFAFSGLLALVLVLAIGCASPSYRAKKNPEAFAALEEEWKALVLKGEIKEGMSTDAVLIAMGKPTWENPSNFMGRDVIGWVYTRLESYNLPNYEYSVATAPDGSLFVTEHYLPLHQIKRVPAIVVFIENDAVLGWQDLDHRRGR